MPERWSTEHVEAIATTPAAYSAAVAIAVPVNWSSLGANDRSVWGAYVGSSGEPYAVAADHLDVATMCTCPSRRRPCKHALALLLLWTRGDVPESVVPPSAPEPATRWIASRATARAAAVAAPTAPDGGRAAGPVDERSIADDAPRAGDARLDRHPERSDAVAPDEAADSTDAPDDHPDSGPDNGTDTDTGPDRDRARDERVARMHAGLTELDRWLEDRLRTGLADPAIARFDTWDELAARLVDAQAGSLANRIRRLAGLVGASDDWHHDVLAEFGVLHLLAEGGRRLGELPPELADRVATAVGWQVRQAAVLAGVPDTDRWIIAGRSDTREDRIEVRRHWLWGERTQRWALALSFAAYGQSLDTSLEVGTVIEADLHRYPGGALRALVGRRHTEPVPARPPAVDLDQAAAAVGAMVAVEPWLDRVPVVVHAGVAQATGRWWLTDASGSLPLIETEQLPTLLALVAEAGGTVDLTVEWTPHGVIPLTVHRPGVTTGATGGEISRAAADTVPSATTVGDSVDVGPVADASFVAN